MLGQRNAAIFGVHLSAIHSNRDGAPPHVRGEVLLRQTAPYRTFHLLTGDFNTLAGDELDVRRLPSRLRALYW